MVFLFDPFLHLFRRDARNMIVRWIRLQGQYA